MLTHGQIKQLAKDFQIDEFTIFREYLQLIFLSYLYRHPDSNKIYFKGGTAIRLLYGSSRFSEDLDFSADCDRKKIQRIMEEIKKELAKELPEAKIFLQYQGKRSIRFRLKYQSVDFKYPFVIRIDFSEKEKVQKVVTSPLITKYPLTFPVLLHLAPEEILAEKIRAFMARGKGQDIFDLWYLLKRGVKIDRRLVQKKLKEINKEFDEQKLVLKIETFPGKKLRLDLGKFVPYPQRKIIESLKKELVSQLA